MPERKRKGEVQKDLQGLSRIGDASALFGLRGGGLQREETSSVPAVREQRLDDLGHVHCEQCDGSGWNFIERDGHRFAQDCPCRIALQQERRMLACGIPKRYAGATLDSYRPTHPSQDFALMKARGFAAEWPINSGRGFVFTGPVGTGKTHLSIAVMREAQAKGARCHWVSLRELMKRLQDSYGGQGPSETEILRPILDAELAVMDEIGAEKASDWKFDTLARIVDTRYNANLTTLFTCNLAVSNQPRLSTTGYGPAVVGPETLRDRIGAPMVSRLMEMCETVEVLGEDFRARRL